MLEEGILKKTSEETPTPIITASHLLEYLFCPRFTYFEYVLHIPQHQEKRFKVVKGRTIHEKIRKVNPGYLRKKLGVRDKKLDVYLANPLKDNYDASVTRGYIIYTRSRNKLIEIPIKDDDFKELKKIVQGILNVIQNCYYPKPTRYKRRCPDCCYKNICEKSI